MFGFLFKKSKGLDKESKGSLKQSTKDFLARRNSQTSAEKIPANIQETVHIRPEISNGNNGNNGKGHHYVSPCSENEKVEVDVDVDVEVTGNPEVLKVMLGNCKTDLNVQMSIPVVLVSSDDLSGEPEKRLVTVTKGDSEERSFCSSAASSTNGDNDETFSHHNNNASSSSMTNLLTTSSSGEEICCNSCTSGIGTSQEDALLKSLMSDTEIEFIDETLDDGSGSCCVSRSGNDSGGSGCEELSDSKDDERELKDTERKAMVQLEELRSKLISKETELSLLQADINMLAVDRDNKIMEIEGMSTQLKALRDENDLSLRRIQNLESELEDLRVKNNQLSDDLLKKAEQLRCLEGSSTKMDVDVGDLQVRIKEYESKLRDLESEKNKILKERKTWEIEREEEIKALQEALDDSVAEKDRLQNKYNHDFAELQSANSNLMDDFEWKLRQIEQNCKKKIQEKDKQIQEKIQEVKDHMKDEFKVEKQRLEQERHQLQEQLNNVAHLKSHEVELTQLRGLTHEQEKSLRSASRQIEHLKLNEKIMSDELRNLRKLLDQEKSHLTVVQNSAQRRIDFHEDQMRSKLDKQKHELNSNWEDKLREECSKLRRELCRSHAEEKELAVDTMRLQKEQEIIHNKNVWEKQRHELQQEISKLKDAITKKEVECNRELSKATTIADRENLDLRRTMEKLSLAHMEEIEEIRESHSQQMESLQERHETAVSKLEKLEKKLSRYGKLYGDLAEEEENEEEAAAKNDDEDDEDEEGDDEEDEEEDDEENSKDSKDKAVIEKKLDSKDSTESLEEIEDEDEEDVEEDDDDLDTSSDNNKNAIYVVEVKNPPGSLTVATLDKAEDKKDLIEAPTTPTTTSSSFISTSASSDSESDPLKKKFCLSPNTTTTATPLTTSASCSFETVPNPPARRRSQQVGRSGFPDGTLPRLGPYGKSRSSTMTSCIMS